MSKPNRWQIIKAMSEASIQLNGAFERPSITPVQLTEDDWNKIAAVVDAAIESEKKFKAINDGFFTGLVPPEFLPISKALRALDHD